MKLQYRRSLVTRLIPVYSIKRLFCHEFLLLLLVFAVPLDAFALSCEGVTKFSDSSNAAYIAEAPHQSARYDSVGHQLYCHGREEEGIEYMKRASDMGDIPASYRLGLYYRTDRAEDMSRFVPRVQENYDAAIFYYERVTSLIESTQGYPYGIHVDLPPLEETNVISIRAPVLLAMLYYTGYARALKEMVNNDVSYTDTADVLRNMQRSAERCLSRPLLSVWKNKQQEIAHSKEVICTARKVFAEKALGLEPRRIEIAVRCEVPLGECPQHKKIFDQIVQAARDQNMALRSVPPI